MPVLSALEMQARYLACAVGEIHAEFLLGDEGAYVHACQAIAGQFSEVMRLDPTTAFRKRNDAACDAGGAPAFQASMLGLEADLRSASSVTRWTTSRLHRYEGDFELPASLQLEPYEVARLLREVRGADLYVLGRPEVLRERGLAA